MPNRPKRPAFADCAASSVRTSDAKIIASPTDWAVCLIAQGSPHVIPPRNTAPRLLGFLVQFVRDWT